MANFGIVLPTRHAYLLDCYIYDWEKNEMPKWMKDMGQGVFTPLINASKDNCLLFDNFIKVEDVCIFKLFKIVYLIFRYPKS